jgi:hypothetical protein
VSTRGFVGFVLDGVEKIYVTHSDSHPSGSGVGVLRWVTANLDALLLPDPGGVLDRIRALRVVADPPVLNPADAERPRTRPVDDGFATDDPDATLLTGFVVDGSDFPTDSRYCEWGYLVDLDRSVFEVYRGFQYGAPTTGRFAGRGSAGRHPVALVAAWHLVELPNRDGFLALPGAY